MRRTLLHLLLGLLAGPPLAGCATEQERYCEAVAEHQAELTEIAAQGDATALLDALDIYRDLREEAPGDIEDEWQQVIGSLEDLDRALDDAGADPATYDPDEPPAGVAPGERARIADAASRVGSLATQQALQGLEQQARDVCKTPLTM